jgi:RNA polymerase sigma-70 factor, ECF subfamily
MQDTIWNSSNLQDQVLISRSQEGDHIAFETLVRKYQHQLLGLVRRHAGPTADEDDLLQLLICKIYFSLKSFDVNRPFFPWLHRVTINLCCDERRRLRRKALTFAELELERIGANVRQPFDEFDSCSAVNSYEMNDMLKTVIGMLPERYQEIITLHHLKQMPYEEIGPILNCSPRAARVKAFRARAALKKLLQRAIVAEGSRSESPSMAERLDACCRQNLAKSIGPGRINSGIKESSQAY